MKKLLVLLMSIGIIIGATTVMAEDDPEYKNISEACSLANDTLDFVNEGYIQLSHGQCVSIVKTCMDRNNDGILDGPISARCFCTFLDAADLLEEMEYENLGQCIARICVDIPICDDFPWSGDDGGP